MKTLLLIRGLPGSGQQFAAAEFQRQTGAKLFEVNGERFKFESRKMDEAQRRIYHLAMEAIKTRDVIVTGTFVTRRSVHPYIRNAQEGLYELFIQELSTVVEPNVAPAYVIKWMRYNWWASEPEDNVHFLYS